MCSGVSEGLSRKAEEQMPHRNSRDLVQNVVQLKDRISPRLEGRVNRMKNLQESQDQITDDEEPREIKTPLVESRRQTQTRRSPYILLVEDNPADVQLMVEAFKESKFEYHLRVANNGVVCMNYLKKRAGFANSRTPDLIILDLNLPKKDGRAVLAELKQDAALKRIPIIVFSMSQAEEDILMSYELNANCFINKPVDLNEFMEVVKVIKSFWLDTAKLPASWGTTH